jgi:glycosyltransferase involved in cell wall biosynthesis
MKITYLLPGWGHTGGSQVLYKFMEMLASRGHEVYAATPDERVHWIPGYIEKVASILSSRPGLYSFAKQVGMKYLPVGRFRTLLGANGVNRILRQNRGLISHWRKSDVTVATFYWTAYAAFALSAETNPLYHMQHWDEVFLENESDRKCARLTYRLPLGLISNSTWLQETVRRRVGKDSQLLLPGVDTDQFYPRVGSDEKFAASSKVRILSYYSPVPFKGWKDALEAMKIVYRELGTKQLQWTVFGGRPPEPVDVPVNFVGRIFGEELAELYSSSHIVFMPSWYESFPLPPLEAMASGAAAIVTGTGTEDYAVDGINSLVLPARNPRRLADGLISLIDDRQKAKSIAESGLNTARRLTWACATNRLEQILQSPRPEDRQAEKEEAAVGVASF